MSLQVTTPRQILDNLISLDNTFVWVEDHGFANIIMRSAYDSPTYPLNLNVAGFTVEDKPYLQAFLGAPGEWGLFQLPQVSPTLPVMLDNKVARQV